MSIQCKGQSLWKYIIVISLDVNTQKCRQRVNKICFSILIFHSWFFDNDKGKRNHCLTYDSVTTPSQMIVFLTKMGLSFEQPKGLHCWDIKADSLPDKSIKIGLQKSAQISVHKCVQKLAYKSTKIGGCYKMERVDECTVSKSNFSRTLKSFCRP